MLSGAVGTATWVNESLSCGEPELRWALSVKHIPEFKDFA